MKNRIPVFFFSLLVMAFGSIGIAGAQNCNRDDLKGFTAQYFKALEAHSTASLPLATKVKYTENGKEVAVGKGFFETSGKPMLKRTVVDTQKCGTHSQAVMEENGRPILFGSRLKFENNKITEIESFIAREKEFAFTPQGVLDTKDQDWETILPPEQRSPRALMVEAANNYFEMFSNDPKVSVPFAKVCDRWENGMQTTKGGMAPGRSTPMAAHDCSPKGLVLSHPPRRFLVDVETGTVVAYVLFTNSLPDFHMFKMRNGKVD